MLAQLGDITRTCEVSLERYNDLIRKEDRYNKICEALKKGELKREQILEFLGIEYVDGKGDEKWSEKE